MKKAFVLFVLFGFVLSFGVCFAEPRICKKCEMGNYDLLCGECGAPKPGEEWTCPFCEEENTTKFCTLCGQEKTAVLRMEFDSDIFNCTWVDEHTIHVEPLQAGSDYITLYCENEKQDAFKVLIRVYPTRE